LDRHGRADDDVLVIGRGIAWRMRVAPCHLELVLRLRSELRALRSPITAVRTRPLHFYDIEIRVVDVHAILRREELRTERGDDRVYALKERYDERNAGARKHVLRRVVRVRNRIR